MKEFKVGLQLYSIREDMEKDMDSALAKVKEMGYDYVEFAGFFGKSASEVKAMLDKYGLKAISVHQGCDPYFEDGQKAIDYLKEIGVEYCAIPWYDENKLKGTEAWDETVEKFTEYGKALKASGIQMMYHNHEFEFNKFEDKFLLDWIYETIPEDLLMPQIDTCWVHYAGYNPSEYIEKYSGRMKVLHLKDFVCKKFGGGAVYALIDGEGGEAKGATREDNGFEFRPVGSGIQDFRSILEAAEKAGIEYVIVEQDGHPERSAMEDAKISREYLKKMGI